MTATTHRTAVYDLARADYRWLGTAELLAEGDAQRAAVAARSELGYADPFAGERLRAARDEWASRQRAGATGGHDRAARHYEAWRSLAQDLRDRADIVAVFEAAGYGFAKAGAAEYAGPCPLCVGRDRFRVFVGPPGRYWCRRCDLTGDVVTAARNFLAPAGGPLGFFEALRRLAAMTGVPVPDDRELIARAPATADERTEALDRIRALAPAVAR